MSYKSTLLCSNWLKDRIANNIPMDQIVRELLTSTGGTFVNPSTNYYQVERDNLKITENVAQVFMGMRIKCAQCLAAILLISGPKTTIIPSLRFLAKWGENAGPTRESPSFTTVKAEKLTTRFIKSLCLPNSLEAKLPN